MVHLILFLGSLGIPRTLKLLVIENKGSIEERKKHKGHLLFERLFHMKFSPVQ